MTFHAFIFIELMKSRKAVAAFVSSIAQKMNLTNSDSQKMNWTIDSPFRRSVMVWVQVECQIQTFKPGSDVGSAQSGKARSFDF